MHACSEWLALSLHHGRSPSPLTAGTVRKSGAYMSALSSIKPGLSDAQKAKQVGRT